MSTFKSNIIQGIVSSRAVICVLSFASLIVLVSTKQFMNEYNSSTFLRPGFHVAVIVNAISSDTLSFGTPIIAVIPMSGIYVEDMRSNFIRYYLFRSSRKAYAVGRLVGCFLSGGMVLFGGVLLAYEISLLAFLPLEVVTEVEAVNNPDLRDIVRAATSLVLSGGFWSVFGLTMSALMESKYIAYSSPFIAFYILTILHERYMNDLFVFAPKEWLNPSSKWVVGSWGPSIVILEFTLLSALLYVFKAERRLREL